MEEAALSEVLCIPGIHKNYAVEFGCIVELCQSMQISAIPCLPEFFSGMINYKGNIIPAVRLEQADKTEQTEIMMILKHERFMLGVLLPPNVFIAAVGEPQKIKLPKGAGEHKIWKEKEIYQVEDRLYALLDVEKTLENLVLYP